MRRAAVRRPGSRPCTKVRLRVHRPPSHRLLSLTFQPPLPPPYPPPFPPPFLDLPLPVHRHFPSGTGRLVSRLERELGLQGDRLAAGQREAAAAAAALASEQQRSSIGSQQLDAVRELPQHGP